jgi:hypothetical protein
MDKNNKDVNNIISYLENTKLILSRIIEDIQLYNKHLDIILDQHEKTKNGCNQILIKKIKVITQIFIGSVINHLSIVDINNGFEKLIKNITENEINNTIYYCGMKKICGEIYIKTNMVVATIDNISINKIFCDKKNITGYEFNIGKNKFFINNNYEKYIDNIDNINEFIENEKNTLEKIEICFATNIDFIMKYKNAFLGIIN